MIDPHSIKEGMAVFASDGEQVGEVDGVETGMGAPGDARIKLKRDASPDGQHHYVPMADVSRVDADVHLDRGAAEIRSGWIGAAVVGPDTKSHVDHGARGVHVEGKNDNRLPWILGVLALLGLLLFGVRSCDRDEPTPAASVAKGNAPAPGQAANRSTELVAPAT